MKTTEQIINEQCAALAVKMHAIEDDPDKGSFHPEVFEISFAIGELHKCKLALMEKENLIPLPCPFCGETPDFPETCEGT
tara:strand:+ start:14190 stop:14429 length:240 start_codon:yes stop_codon:yes gene_type:complete